MKHLSYIFKKIKEDKDSYKAFLNSTPVIISFIIESMIIINVFVERLNIYLKK